MKQTIIALGAILGLISCSPDKQSAFELKGTFTESNGEVIYLEKLMSPQPVLVDSTSVDENGNFSFKNYTPKIGFYRIKVNAQNFAALILDSADKVTVTGSLKDLGNTYKVTGSPETTLFMEYNELGKANKFQQDSLNLAFQTAMGTLKMDSLKMDSLSKIFQPPYDAMMSKFSRLLAEKLKSNPSMYASLLWLQGLEPSENIEIYKTLDAALMKRFPNDKMVRSIHEGISKELATLAGEEAPEINLPTPDGKDLSLSSLRGKIVLIDFWASWCGPCIKEMPNVVKIYSKYKNKGFEIYGVSLDQDREKWLAAISREGMTWPQVSDLQYWNSVAAKLYAVQGIPYTVLVDAEGKIIAKGLRGLELEQAIDMAVNNSGDKTAKQ